MILKTSSGAMIYLPESALSVITLFTIGKEARKEAGGIFIGAYRGDHIEIVNCTVPRKKDKRKYALFDRRDPGHQAEALEAWRTSGGTLTYVGEWHTHPEAHPTPSHMDQKTWSNVMKTTAPFPLVFFVQGTSSHWCALGYQGILSRAYQIANSDNGEAR